MSSITTVNPATGEPIATYETHTDAEVDATLDRALEAYASWREVPFGERARHLRALADRLEGDATRWASLMTQEMGKPLAQAEAEANKCAWVCRYYADLGEQLLAPRPIETDASDSHVRYDPLGAVLAVMPWNFPFWQVMRFAAPSLMAGNVGLLKHASGTTGCAIALEELFASAGFPEGTFAHLRMTNEQTTELIADSRIAAVTLTGSVGAGRAVAGAAGAALKPVVLELGGADPLLVLPGADLDAAVDGAMTGRFQNNGQSCIAAKRFIVVRGLHQAFLDRLEERVRALRVGDPHDAETDVGPMSSAGLAADLDDQLRRSVDAGARLVVDGGRRGETAWFEPALLDGVEPGMPAFDEEMFGPVAAVTVAEDVEHAVELANTSDFGLGATVWTEDVELARSIVPRIESGHVSVNGIVKSDPRLPFGGVKDSGIGRELSAEGIRAFMNVKTVWVR